jgi:hypothetical protein
MPKRKLRGIGTGGDESKLEEILIGQRKKFIMERMNAKTPNQRHTAQAIILDINISLESLKLRAKKKRERCGYYDPYKT